MYTRYIDDIAISFRQFGDIAKHMEDLTAVIKSSQKLRGYLPDTDETKESIRKQINLILEHLDTSVEVPNEHARFKLRHMYVSLKELVSDAMDHPYAVLHPIYKQQMFSLVHQIHLRMKNLDQQDTSHDEALFRKKIQKIVNANGWTLKLSKDKFRGP